MSSDVTRILSDIEQGDPSAADQLLPLVYDELRKLAAQRLAQEKPGQTLQATALVHEAYLRLVDVEKAQHWNSRGHFFAAAAEAIRRILVESARHKQSLRHGGELQRHDLDVVAARLAAQAPWWQPGTASGYHGLTFGHLIGEVIRRITGQRLGEFFAAQIAGPLGADFYIGLPLSEFHRVANVVPPPSHPDDLTQLDPNSVEFKTKTGPAITAELSWTERWRRADIGAANGHGNARSVRASSPRWPAAAKSTASGCSRRRRSTGSSKCKATRSTS